MAGLTKGYPFAFQVLGYLTWNHNGDYLSVVDEYEQYLSEFVYDKICTLFFSAAVVNIFNWNQYKQKTCQIDPLQLRQSESNGN